MHERSNRSLVGRPELSALVMHRQCNAPPVSGVNASWPACRLAAAWAWGAARTAQGTGTRALPLKSMRKASRAHLTHSQRS